MAFGHAVRHDSDGWWAGDVRRHGDVGNDQTDGLMLLDDDGTDMAELLGAAASNLLGLTGQRPGSAIADRFPGRLAELSAWGATGDRQR